MNHISRMKVLDGFEQLIHNILLVNVLQYVPSFYYIVQVSIYSFCTHSILYSCSNKNQNPPM